MTDIKEPLLQIRLLEKAKRRRLEATSTCYFYRSGWKFFHFLAHEFLSQITNTRMRVNGALPYSHSTFPHPSFLKRRSPSSFSSLSILFFIVLFHRSLCRTQAYAYRSRKKKHSCPITIERAEAEFWLGED